MTEIENMVYYVNWNFSNNIQMSLIGELLFNRLYILFIGAALLLFIAMIGAIVLTMDDELIVVKNENKNRVEKKRFYSININWKYLK